MANKKKKKNNRPKVEITVTFDTKRTQKGIDFRKAQMKLYEQSSCEEIEDALNYYGILLHADEILEDYKDCLNVDQLAERYHQRYIKELEVLNSKKLILDEDGIYFFLTKVVSENLDTSRLPDPEYIVDYALKYIKLPQEEKAEALIRILINLKNLSQYTNERNIHVLFSETGYDLEEILTDIIQEDLINLEIAYPELKEIYQLIDSLITIYQWELPENLFIDFIELITKANVEDGIQVLNRGFELFPAKKLTLYNASLCGLDANPDQESEKIRSLMKEEYKQAMQVPYDTTSKKQIYKLIQENFGYLEQK